MLKLFKYELRKTLMSKLIMLGLIVCLEALFLYGIFAKSEQTATLGIILMILAAIFGVVIIGIQSIITLHHDINSKQSYMLFMTPNSNYAILGAKVLECMVSVLLSGAVLFGVIVLDYRLIMNTFADIAAVRDFLEPILQTFGQSISLDLPTITVFVLNTVISWIETVVLAFFADVLATSLLKGKKFGGLLAFVLFIILTLISDKLAALIPAANGSVGITLLRSAVMLVIAAVVYAATAKLMEKKLSV